MLPQRSTLFHYSRNRATLLEANRFDSKYSSWGGAFFFSNVPIPDMSNCQVLVSEMLLLLSTTDLSDSDWERLRLIGGILSGSAALGFDGYINREGDDSTQSEEGYAPEVVIFRESLHKLGIISPYIIE